MPHSFSHAVSMNLEHSIKEGSHERYPDDLQCFRNIKKIKYPDFQAMTKKLSFKTHLLTMIRETLLTAILSRKYQMILSTRQKILPLLLYFQN